MLKRLRAFTIKLLKIYGILTLLFFVCIVVVYALPARPVQANVQRSLGQFRAEGSYPIPFAPSTSLRLDNVADMLMLNLSATGDVDNTLMASMSNPLVNHGAEKLDALQAAAAGSKTKITPYARYWHGYLVVLRPLLEFFTYPQLRGLNMWGLLLLFGATLALLWRRLGKKAAFAFFCAMTAVSFYIVPMNFEFSPVFYLAMLAMLAILLTGDHFTGAGAVYFFFVVGALTSYFDFLTAPLLTLCLPVFVCLILRQKKPAAKNTLFILKNSCTWFAGYGLLWATKWVIASLILRQNVVSNALADILFRTGGNDQYPLNRGLMLQRNVHALLYNPAVNDFAILFAAVCILLFLFFPKSKRELLGALPFLLMAAYPYIWYMMAANHSEIHYYFTYREQAVTVICLVYILMYCIDFRKIYPKIKAFHLVRKPGKIHSAGL